MGAVLSHEERSSIATEIYMLYPGLEQQLEMAFCCHDIQKEGTLSFSTLEPVLRHLLMQYGLIEYVTRFSTPDGCLDFSHVRREMDAFGVSAAPGGSSKFCSKKISLQHFKYMAVIWLRKVLESHAEDQAEWSAKLRAEQEEQAKEYTRAMREFQEKYTQQNALYQQGLKEQQKQISDWNLLLESAQKTQQQIYEQELQRAEEKKKKEASAAEEAVREQMQLISQYKEKLESIAKTDKSGKCFVYPAAATPYGACASAGAQEPTRRRRLRSQQQQRAEKKVCC